MNRNSLIPWELLARATDPDHALAGLLSSLVEQTDARRLAIGVADPAVPTLRWLAAAGPESAGDTIVYLSTLEAQRINTYLARHPVTRSAASSLPRPLTPILPPGREGTALIAALLPGDGAPHRLPAFVLAHVPDGGGAAAARVLESWTPPLTIAVERAVGRALAPPPARAASAAPSAATSVATGDRDGLSDKIIGADGGLRVVMLRVGQVSRSDVPVLILGETGSGKEVVARALHAGSPRAGGAFVRVNCGAIPPEMIDSELFGHERGSFTGASAQRRGWFEQADGGTLLLDEIGELPLAAQVRLLRILQEGSFQRVGGERTVSVDVRVVAATHRDLSAMVEDGRFREDLWYRLAVFPIRLPPLREHPEDIPAMAAHFVRRAAERFGVPLRALSGDDLARLMAYAWPGNVRELGAVLDRAVLLGEGERLEIAKALGEAPPRERRSTGAGEATRAPTALPAAGDPGPDDDAPFPTLDEAMRRHIEAALLRCSGRIEGPRGAARLLGINPHTLRGRMRRLGVVWRGFRG